MQWLVRISSWKNAGAFLVANFLLQAIIVIGIYPEISDKLKPLDIQMHLTTGSIQQYLTAIGENGRALYFFNESVLDILFPIAYGCAYTLLLMQLVKGCGQAQGPLQYLPLLPLGIALCDFTENLLILTAIDQFPALSPETAHWLAAANMGKHSLTLVVLTALTVLSCWFAVIKLSQPQADTKN